MDRNTPKTDTHPDANAQQPATVFPPAKIEAYVPPVKLTFHLVTAEQVDIYAQMGHLAQLFLTLFGIALGSAIAFWIALNQGELSPASSATFTTAMGASKIGTLVSLCLAALFYCLQCRRRREWFTSTWPTA